jgi:transcriptional regulator with XRE-family HTH domain
MAIRSKMLPITLRQALVAARKARGWSQVELGRQAGLPQMHISAIETGKVAPRVDTFVELARLLGFELMLVPRERIPVVQALLEDRDTGADEPLYAPDEGDASGAEDDNA